MEKFIQEKEKQINGCDLHDECIPTQKLKVMLEKIYPHVYVCVIRIFHNIILILTENTPFHLFVDSSRMPGMLFDT